MKTPDIYELRQNIPHVGCSNDDALALCDEVERLRELIAEAKAYIEFIELIEKNKEAKE